MSFYRTSKPPTAPTGITEFEILKAKHKFLHEDGEDEAATPGSGSSTWDDQLAKKYYDSLYREFAICDLKHFKTGNFSLRWRTEDEVLSSTGDTTCSNSRCEFHHGNSQYRDRDAPPPPLTTLELPFGYLEHGESKSALVKVVLCPGCVRKLMWKRTKEKEREQRSRSEGEEGDGDTKTGGRREGGQRGERGESTRRSIGMEDEVMGSAEESRRRRKRRERSRDGENEDRSLPSRPRRDRSRSRSPRRKELNEDGQREKGKLPSRST